MQLNGKKVLVTGADGFIGSHLTEHLVRFGNTVRAFVYYNSLGSRGWLEHSPKNIQGSIEVLLGDVRDAGSVRQAVKGCDVVFHLAALIAIPYSFIAPDSYVETNVRGTLNMVQAAREFGVERFVHTSTSEVYGTARFVPITEDHPLQGQSPYAASKVGADQMAMSFHSAFGIPVSVIRPFNTYGPRQSARAVIPTIITQIIQGKRLLDLGALHPTRDFNYVHDIVRAFIAVAESDVAVGEVINVGSNFEISIGDTAALIADIMGVQIRTRTDAARLRPPKAEVERLWADNTKAKALLGWEPQYGGLDGLRRGLTETIEWFQNAENACLYNADAYHV